MSSSDSDEDDIFTRLSAIAVQAGRDSLARGGQCEASDQLAEFLERGFLSLELRLLLPHSEKLYPATKIAAGDEVDAILVRLSSLVQKFVDGEYLAIVKDEVLFQTFFSKAASDEPLQKSSQATADMALTERREILGACLNLQRRARQYVVGDATQSSEDDDDEEEESLTISFERRARTFEVLLAAISCLNIYVQTNYTGPPVVSDVRPFPELESHANSATSFREVLEVEGFDAFVHCEHPDFLVAARSLLTVLQTPNGNPLQWCDREVIREGVLGRPEKNSVSTGILTSAAAGLKSVAWWCARSTVTHHRTLSVGIEGSAILKRMTADQFSSALRRFPSLNQDQEMVTGPGAIACAQLHLEWGLAQHYYNESEGGKASIRQAQLITKLSVDVSGAMGLRGVWQKKDTAQMVIKAESRGVLPQEQHADAMPKVVVEEIPLTEFDRDTNLREQIKFTGDDKEEIYIADLSLIDQAIILGLCTDVKNTNPRDGLTNEQMSAYIARIMAIEHNRNWMVHTTSLVVKAWVEFERWKTKERSVMQLQALVDQHTNRLTIGQMPTTDINSPAGERMAILYALVMPPIWQMKRSLADRYMGIYVKKSALDLYRELQLWEDVVQCLLDTQQDTEAKKLVKEQLASKPTPMLWTCLGELENNDEHYRTGWELSKGRYARAMRLLGKRYFEREDYLKSNECYLAALAIRPQEHHAWWRVGTASMRIENWDLALRAWTHCARLEPTDGEAWGNMGAVFCQQNRLDEAYNAFDQGLKHQRQNWKMWENFMLLSVRTKRYGRALYAQEQLLSLRHKREGFDTMPIDIESLNVLTNVIATSLHSEHDPSVLKDLSDEEKDRLTDWYDTKASFHGPRLRRFFESATAQISTVPPLWAMYGELCLAMGDIDEARACCSSEVRALKSEEDWAQQEDMVQKVTAVILRLVELTEKIEEEYEEKTKNTVLLVDNTIVQLKKFFDGSDMVSMLQDARVNLLKGRN
jgi:tetratricopeptide (TPR) repeat protein